MSKNTLDALYSNLRDIVRDDVIISFHDKQTWNEHPEVGLVFQKDSYHWTHFQGKNLVDAFGKALNKLTHPEQDYQDITGEVWKANEESCYNERHIRTFLKEKLFCAQIKKESP